MAPYYYILEFCEDESKCQFWKVDVDECSALSQRAAIRSMPTFQVYKGGVQVMKLFFQYIYQLDDASQHVFYFTRL